MPDRDALLAKAHAGERIAAILAEPEFQALYQDAVSGLEFRVLEFDPSKQMETTIAKAMRLGIKEFWAKLEGAVAMGQQAESLLAGELPKEQPGRVL